MKPLPLQAKSNLSEALSHFHANDFLTLLPPGPVTITRSLLAHLLTYRLAQEASHTNVRRLVFFFHTQALGHSSQKPELNENF